MIYRLGSIVESMSKERFFSTLDIMSNLEEKMLKKIQEKNPNTIHVKRKVGRWKNGKIGAVHSIYWRGTEWKKDDDYGMETFYAENLDRQTLPVEKIDFSGGVELLKEKSIRGQRMFLASDFSIKTEYAKTIHRCGKLIVLEGGENDGRIYDSMTLKLKYIPVTQEEYVNLWLD